jgi:acyl-coenzyme A thioesterase PaaI-like protein
VTTAKANPALDHAAPRHEPPTETFSPPPRPPASARKRPLMDRLENYISRLSTRNNFWHKVCSLIWLPYAFRSGITMKRLNADRFSAVLPFRRFNRNWYNAMAGAALLGNSEVAAGMYLFAQCGGDYVVVCKELKYRFLRPCYGPAVYHVVSAETLEKKLAAGGEFNVDVELEITQQLKQQGKELRVGRCNLTFHCTPKTMVRERESRRKARLESQSEGPRDADRETPKQSRSDGPAAKA